MTTNDAASTDLNAAPLPIPTEQRLDVFVVDGCDPEAQEIWGKKSAGGASNFHCVSDCTTGAGFRMPERPFVEFCGVCLFSGEYVTPEQWRTLQPFFARAKAETNCFQFCPVRKNFTRRDELWFDGRILKTKYESNQ